MRQFFHQHYIYEECFCFLHFLIGPKVFFFFTLLKNDVGGFYLMRNDLVCG